MSITTAQAFECSYTTPDGRYVFNDLAKLTRTTDFTSFDGIYWYTLNVCGFSNNKNCSGVHGSICTLTPDGMVIDAIGQFGAGREPYWTVTYENQPQVGVTLSFDNGKFDGKDTHVRLNLVCDMGALTSNNNFTTIYTREMFVMSLKTPYACPKYVGDEPKGAGAAAGTTDNENTAATNEQTHVSVGGPAPAASLPVSPVPSAPPSGLSGGSIFLIMLCVFIPLYIGIGCFYKSQHLGTTGLESCPHYAFWQQVPRYVHDGCLFSYRYIQGLFNRDHERPNRDEYDGL